MRLSRSGPISSFLTFAGLSLGAVATVPADKPTMPYYFSGTNCRASGSVVSSGVLPNGSIEEIELIQLYIGGELVRSLSVPPEDELRAGGSLSVIFDSTHFAPGTNLEVKIRGLTNHGTWVEATGNAPVKNRITAYNRSDFVMSGGVLNIFADGAAQVRSSMTNKNYTLNCPSIFQGWSTDTLYDDLDNCSVLYLNTHGNSDENPESNAGDFHSTDLEQYITPWATWPTSYEDWRKTKNGLFADYPPYNYTGKPPMRFLMLDTCWNGSNAAFIAIPWPFYDAYGQYIINQAFMGYGYFSQVASSRNSALGMFSRLKLGWTVMDSRDQAIDDSLNVLAKRIYIRETTSVLTPWRSVANDSDWQIYGDPFTTIKNVYRGISGQSLSWFTP